MPTSQTSQEPHKEAQLPEATADAPVEEPGVGLARGPATVGRYFAAHDRKGGTLTDGAFSARLFRAAAEDLPAHTQAAILATYRSQDHVLPASRAALQLEMQGLVLTVDALLNDAAAAEGAEAGQKVRALSRQLQELAGLQGDLT